MIYNSSLVVEKKATNETQSNQCDIQYFFFECRKNEYWSYFYMQNWDFFYCVFYLRYSSIKLRSKWWRKFFSSSSSLTLEHFCPFLSLKYSICVYVTMMKSVFIPRMKRKPQLLFCLIRLLLNVLFQTILLHRGRCLIYLIWLLRINVTIYMKDKFCRYSKMTHFEEEDGKE